MHIFLSNTFSWCWFSKDYNPVKWISNQHATFLSTIHGLIIMVDVDYKIYLIFNYIYMYNPYDLTLYTREIKYYKQIDSILIKM